LKTQKIVFGIDSNIVQNLLSQGGEEGQVSFSIAFPPPQRELAQL
jgi:hypothetical protein